MVRLCATFASVFLVAALAQAADDPLVRARTLYNQRQFDAALIAAQQARLVPAQADAADLVAARAYLERYRESAAADDLAGARERLRGIDPRRFSPRERTEYIVGLGETLYFEGSFGGAASVFDSVLMGGDLLTGDAHERVLDWWATAIDRDARLRAETDRLAEYQRIRARTEGELAIRPSSSAAAYWMAAAARSQGDARAAWAAAQAGWVRSALVGDGGTALRADLDRLVLVAVAPDLAKATAQSQDALQLQWEQFKERWTR
jgi:hypothetical protein